MQNHVLQSQNLAVTWGVSNVVPTVGDPAPDGTATGNRLTETAVNSSHFVSQTIATIAYGAKYTFSVYAKKGVGRDYIALAGDGGNAVVWFNLATGAIGTPSGALGMIEDVGGGWYRCSITWVAGAISASRVVVIYMANADGSASYLGDVNNYVFLWGAQVTDTSTPSPYVKTTTTSNLGRARGRSPRQNVLKYSNAFTTVAGWGAGLGLASIVAVAGAGPDGGTATRLTEDTANNVHLIAEQASTSIVGLTYTFSVYAKADANGGDYVLVAANNGSIAAGFNLATGKRYMTSGLVLATSITHVGNGWYRCSVTYVHTASGSARIYIDNGTGAALYVGASRAILIAKAQISLGRGVVPYVENATTALVNEGAARGESPKQNFLRWSEDVDNAVWTKQTNFVVTANDALAPDGTMTADKIDGTTGSVNLGVLQVASISSAVSRPLCRSVWVKGTPGEIITIADPVASIGIISFTFDGTWQRIWLTEPAGGSGGGSGIWIRKNTANIWWMWGAQISETLTPPTYVKTTDIGVSEDAAPRGQTPRQNFVTNFNIATWTTSTCTLTSLGTTGPHGASIYRLASNTAASTEHPVYTQYGAQLPGIVVTHTVYMRAGTKVHGFMRSGAADAVVIFDLTTGATNAITSTNLLGYSCRAVGNGWFRCSITYRQAVTEFVVFGPSDPTTYFFAENGPYIDVCAPQRSYSFGPIDYIGSFTNEGTPRGTSAQQNLCLQSSNMTVAPWADSNTTRVADTDGYFALTDTSAGAFGLVSQAIAGCSVGRMYSLQFKVRKTTGGVSPTFGCNFPGAFQLRLNTDSGVWNQGEMAASAVVATVDDGGDHWLVVLTGAAGPSSTVTVEFYPAVGPHHAAPTTATQSAATTGTSYVKEVSFTESRGIAVYAATGATAVNEGAPRAAA